MASPDSFPVTLLVDSRWDEQERQAVIGAAQSWNDLAARSGKEPFFNIRIAAVTDLSRSEDIEACSLPQGSAKEFVVAKIATTEAWGVMGFTNSTPAVTIRCHSGDDIRKQAVLVNSGLITLEQLQSVFVHEFGHVLGLDHSCQLGGGTDTFLSCNGLEPSHPYYEAVMYPALRIALPVAKLGWPSSVSYKSGSLEIKELIRQNDAERASCLFTE